MNEKTHTPAAADEDTVVGGKGQVGDGMLVPLQHNLLKVAGADAQHKNPARLSTTRDGVCFFSREDQPRHWAKGGEKTR